MTRSSIDRPSHSIHVELGARSYAIVIRRDLLQEIGEDLKRLKCAGKVGVVTDRNLAKHYLTQVTRRLKAAGFTVVPVVLPPGERTKTLHSIGTVMDALVNARFERSSTLLALGGGVIGDITGFAAAIYQRGIPFVQVPTSLVAQVDSSVGGKTGVDHPKGKNLIGAFNQPRAVFIDPAMLATLPPREWVAGLAEVIKYGVIADAAFFEYLEQNMESIQKLTDDAVAHIVKRSCEIKAQVVSEDERESDRRRILNFGHTIGKAIALAYLPPGLARALRGLDSPTPLPASGGSRTNISTLIAETAARWTPASRTSSAGSDTSITWSTTPAGRSAARW